jgi:hypothetical protein
MPSPIPRQDRWDCSLISHRRRPSLDSRRVGSCITRFGACTAFTIVTACKLAKSPTRPSTPEASAASLPPLLLRLLPGGANQFPGGILPAVDQRLFTAHAKVGLAGENKLGLYRQCGGARKSVERGQSTYAAALPIQPVVVSRGTAMAPMGIEYSSAYGGRLRRVVWPRCSVPSAWLEVDGGVN